jgi:hypothetical protein
MTLGGTITTAIRPSSTAAVITSGGGALDSYTTEVMAILSSTRAGNGSVHEGWGRARKARPARSGPGASGTRG